MKFAAIIATIASMAAFAMAAPIAKEGTYHTHSTSSS
jgi:hypothetical protein